MSDSLSVEYVSFERFVLFVDGLVLAGVPRVRDDTTTPFFVFFYLVLSLFIVSSFQGLGFV